MQEEVRKQVRLGQREPPKMRTVEITEDELDKVMRDRLQWVLSGEVDHHAGAILICGMKPGLTYAYKRMSAREHVQAARLLLRHAQVILEKKEIVANDTFRALQNLEHEVYALVGKMPSEMAAG